MLSLLTLAPFHGLSKSKEYNTLSQEILIVYDNSFDYQIALEIANANSKYNYTVQSTFGIDNISDYLFPLEIDHYSSIVLILSTSIQQITDTIIMKFQEYLNKSRSLTFISSKIWQLPILAKELLGIEYSSGPSQEFIPNQMENYTLTVNNNSYLQFSNEYLSGTNITFNTKLGIIDERSGNVFDVLTSNLVELGQNKTGKSGVYVKENYQYNSSSLSIPISLLRTPDPYPVDLITTLVHSLISHFQIPDDSFNPSTTIPTDNLFPKLSISPETVGDIILVGTALVIGISSYKAISVIRKKEEDELIESSQQEDLWSLDQSIFFPFISLFIGFFSAIGAIIYSQRYSRLSVFQVKDNPIRQQIVDILENHEFEHFNSLQKKLKTGVSILLWHLKVLEDFEIIKMEKIGQYKIIYLFDHTPNPQEVHYYCNIRAEVAIGILRNFLKRNTWSLDNLSTLLSTSPELIKYHCSKLVSLEILFYDKLNKIYSINVHKISVVGKVLDKHKQNGK